MNPKVLFGVSALVYGLFNLASNSKRKKEQEYRRKYQKAHANYRRKVEKYDKEYQDYKSRL